MHLRPRWLFRELCDWIKAFIAKVCNWLLDQDVRTLILGAQAGMVAFAVLLYALGFFIWVLRPIPAPIAAPPDYRAKMFMVTSTHKAVQCLGVLDTVPALDVVRSGDGVCSFVLDSEVVPYEPPAPIEVHAEVTTPATSATVAAPVPATAAASATAPVVFIPGTHIPAHRKYGFPHMSNASLEAEIAKMQNR